MTLIIYYLQIARAIVMISEAKVDNMWFSCIKSWKEQRKRKTETESNKKNAR